MIFSLSRNYLLNPLFPWDCKRLLEVLFEKIEAPQGASAPVVCRPNLWGHGPRCQECVLSASGESIELLIPKLCLRDLMPAPPTSQFFSPKNSQMSPQFFKQKPEKHLDSSSLASAYSPIKQICHYFLSDTPPILLLFSVLSDIFVQVIVACCLASAIAQVGTLASTFCILPYILHTATRVMVKHKSYLTAPAQKPLMTSHCT